MTSFNSVLNETSVDVEITRISDPKSLEKPESAAVDESALNNAFKSHDETTSVPTTSFYSTDSDDYEFERETWGGPWEYFISLCGFTIAYEDLWRFPRLLYTNGGVVFLIPYLLVHAALGLPLLLVESGLGQFTSRCEIATYNVCPLFKGISFTKLSMLWLWIWYNSMNLSWILYYFFSSLGEELPWSDCGNKWNTEYCIDSTTNNTELKDSNRTILTQTAAEEFWENNVLQLADGIEHFGNVRWPLLGCNVLGLIIVYLCVFRNIRELGKIALMTAIFPVLVLSVLLFRGISLPGGLDGIRELFDPDWSKLASFDVWITAAFHVFYSLGLGMGGITTLSSYNRFKSNAFRYSLYVSYVDMFVSVFAATVIFTFLGNLSLTSGISIDSLIKSGPGLFFVAFPLAISKMLSPHVWAKIFFAMLYCIGLDVQCFTLDVGARCIIDELPNKWKRKSAEIKLLVCIVQCVLGILASFQGSLYLITLVDHYSTLYSLLLVAFLEVTGTAWFYGAERFLRDLELMSGKKQSIYWTYMLRYITPVLVMIMYLNTLVTLHPPVLGNYTYPAWATAIGATIALVQFSYIPAWSIYVIYREKSGTLKQRVLKLIQPAATYHPLLEEDNQEYVASFSEFELLRYKATKNGMDWRTYEETKGDMEHTTFGETETTMSMPSTKDYVSSSSAP